jgi:uncharacterized lipoprotein YmbA
MGTRMSATLGLVGLALVVTGCVSLKRTPEARFFVLQPLIPPRPATAGETLTGIVGVEDARLPDHLARPQIVTWTAPNELRIDEFLRWAEPLDAGITRTLAEDLAVLLPDHQLVLRPWPGDTALRCRVLVTLSVFGLQRDGMVRLEGRWALLPDRGELAFVQQPVSLQRGPVATAGDGVPSAAGVDLMSDLVADLSRQIADAIRALPPEEQTAGEEDEAAATPESADR